jgi:UDP-glucose 4-epimerase
MNKKLRSVVFGGSGFLGSHIADTLSEAGHDVTIFDLVESPYLRSDQKMIVGTMQDTEALLEITACTDYVYHFAGVADIGYARENPKETYFHNVMGTLNLLEASRKNQIKRFLFASTIYVYSELGSFYRSSKQSCEMLIENYKEEYDLPFTILRYGSLYGPRANKFNFINNSIHEALTKKQINRKGTGNEIRDYIHVSDAAHASVKTLEESFKDSYVMIKGNQSMRVSEILQTLSEILGGEVEVNYSDKDHYDAHYSLTPYSFKPRSAKHIQLDSYFDIGQGLLETIYEIYQDIDKKKLKIKFNPK